MTTVGKPLENSRFIIKLTKDEYDYLLKLLDSREKKRVYDNANYASSKHEAPEGIFKRGQRNPKIDLRCSTVARINEGGCAFIRC